jgi:hypothetical protein
MSTQFSLRNTFSVQNLRAVWHDRVWPALRDQGCEDMIEYYDYNATIAANVQKLSPKVINGNYRTSLALLLELNKADKLVRQIQVPTPEDALVFQAIAETILPLAMSHSATTKAFFAWSHSTPKGIHTMDVSPLYPWFKLWPKYQTEILDFAKAHKYLVITDIQNFFDSVPHSAMDRALTLIGADQRLRDFTLYMLEGFVRRDLYEPLILRGLPQFNLDAPRLLAHVLLFPIDKYVDKRTRGAFARWVDDINFGVDTKREARDIIRAVERFLARIELRLNGPKTQVLSRQEAEEFLFVTENLKLTNYQKEIKNSKITAGRVEDLYEDFLFFSRKGPQLGHWDQVYRRYINLISSTLSLFVKHKQLIDRRRDIAVELQKGCSDNIDYRNRQTIVRYWERRSVSRDMLDYLVSQLSEVSRTDDVIAFRLAHVLVSANISKALIARLCKRLFNTKRRVGSMLGVATLLCKYGTADKIEQFIIATQNEWSANEFLSRQAISLWSILSPSSSESIRLRTLISRNVSTAGNDLICYYEELRETKSLPAGLEGYVSPAKMKRPYTLAKAIITSNLLRSQHIPGATRSRIESAFTKVTDERLTAIALNALHT